MICFLRLINQQSYFNANKELSNEKQSEETIPPERIPSRYLFDLFAVLSDQQDFLIIYYAVYFIKNFADKENIIDWRNAKMPYPVLKDVFNEEYTREETASFLNAIDEIDRRIISSKEDIEREKNNIRQSIQYFVKKFPGIRALLQNKYRQPDKQLSDEEIIEKATEEAWQRFKNAQEEIRRIVFVRNLFYPN